METLIQSWELQLELLDQKIKTGPISSRVFFQIERDVIAKYLQEEYLQEELKSELRIDYGESTDRQASHKAHGRLQTYWRSLLGLLGYNNRN